MTAWPRRSEYPPTHMGLIRYVADRNGISYRRARGMVDSFIDFIHITVRDHQNKLEVARIGVFSWRFRPAVKKADGIIKCVAQYRLHLSPSIFMRDGGWREKSR